MSSVFSPQTIDSIIFKKFIFGKSASNKTRNPTEESINTQFNIYERQMIKYAKYIPTSAPPTFVPYTGITGNYILNGYQLTGASELSFYYDSSIVGYTGPLLVKITGLPFLPVNPVDKHFYHPSIKNIIPFNYASNYYEYTLRNSVGEIINPTNSSAWYLDPESGTLTLFETPDTTNITPTNPPRLDFIMYVGPMGPPPSEIMPPANTTGFVLYSDGAKTVFRPEFQENQYREDNFTNSIKVTITHNYNHKPYVTVVDEEYNNVFVYTLTYLNDNSFEVEFTSPQDGIIITQGMIGSTYEEREFIQSFTSTTNVVVNHNWEKIPKVTVYDSSNDEIVMYDLQYDSNNTLTITFDTPKTGHVVLHGSHWPIEPLYIEQEFDTPTTELTIVHNFNKKPSVTVLDDSNVKIPLNSINHIDDNRVEITFATPKTGRVILQGTFGAKDPNVAKSAKIWEKDAVGNIKNRGRNVVTGADSVAIGKKNVLSGQRSFVTGEKNRLFANNSSILGGKNITATQDDTSYVPKLAILQGITESPPTSSADTKGIVGELWFDNDYFYIKTADPLNPWKRVALNTF